MNSIFNNNKKWPLLFTIVFVIQLLAIIIQNETLRTATKPLLLLVLMLYYVFNTSKKSIIVIAGIALSWLGDVLLIFQENNEMFFTFGLASFLIAQLMYAYYFTVQFKNRQQKFSKILMLVVGLYAAGIYFLLLPKLGAMQIPVLIYALSISCMLIAAVQLFLINKKYLLCAIGAILFVASDSILAINKFHTQFLSASFLVMLTYGLAQFLIIAGILKNENEESAVQ